MCRQAKDQNKKWSVRNLKHLWSNWLVVYNSIVFIISMYIVTHVMQKAYKNKHEPLNLLYSKHDSPIRLPFIVMECSLVVESFHRYFGIQNFGDHVFINWGINLFVLFFVLNVFPEVSLGLFISLTLLFRRTPTSCTGSCCAASTSKSATCTTPTAPWA